jgi:CTP synthase (UTP-ammonia lyase)
MPAPSLAVVADFNPAARSHVATNDAIRHAADALGLKLAHEWIGTHELRGASDLERLKQFRAIWIGPGSPYANMDGALTAIRYARENRIPLLGTCGGFQHIIIEHARNVLGISGAEHEETAPDASQLAISRLACSLAGRAKQISLEPGSKLAEIYGVTSVEEEYLCNFGVNPAYVERLAKGPLQIVASDDEGAIRGVELPGHPFFIGTLFLPQHRSSAEKPHPLVTAFVQQAAQ